MLTQQCAKINLILALLLKFVDYYMFLYSLLLNAHNFGFASQNRALRLQSNYCM